MGRARRTTEVRERRPHHPPAVIGEHREVVAGERHAVDADQVGGDRPFPVGPLAGPRNGGAPPGRALREVQDHLLCDRRSPARNLASASLASTSAMWAPAGGSFGSPVDSTLRTRPRKNRTSPGDETPRHPLARRRPPEQALISVYRATAAAADGWSTRAPASDPRSTGDRPVSTDRPTGRGRHSASGPATAATRHRADGCAARSDPDRSIHRSAPQPRARTRQAPDHRSARTSTMSPLWQYTTPSSVRWLASIVTTRPANANGGLSRGSNFETIKLPPVGQDQLQLARHHRTIVGPPSGGKCHERRTLLRFVSGAGMDVHATRRASRGNYLTD